MKASPFRTRHARHLGHRPSPRPLQRNIIERIHTSEATFPHDRNPWPSPPTSANDKDWEGAKQRLWSSLDAVKQMLETTPMSQIENSKYGLPDLLCRYIHVGYHIGQIVKIREMR